jgi:hypothetical protein
VLDERNQLAILCDRFHALSKQYGHAPRGRTTPEVRRLYNHAQTELFQLAQAICKIANPEIQANLEVARSEIMEQVRVHVKVATGARVVSERPIRAVAWYDFQITPEISFDPNITGNAVLRDELKRLKAALRAQYGVLMHALGTRT